jgi:hypothetical protein
MYYIWFLGEYWDSYYSDIGGVTDKNHKVLINKIDLWGGGLYGF